MLTGRTTSDKNLLFTARNIDSPPKINKEINKEINKDESLKVKKWVIRMGGK